MLHRCADRKPVTAWTMPTRSGHESERMKPSTTRAPSRSYLGVTQNSACGTTVPVRRRVAGTAGLVIFKTVQDGRPYPAHDLLLRDWAAVPPRQVRLDQLVTPKKVLALDVLLDDDSTFYGDLFPHVVQWHDELYLEDGLHRALRAALQQRSVLHVRVLNLDAAAATPSAVTAVVAGDR